MQAKAVEYQEGAAILEGFVAFDDGKPGNRPGVLLVPEWYGVTDFARKRCLMLAELGYVAFAADVYGKGVRPTAYDDCAREMAKYKNNRPLLRARTQAGLNELRKQPNVDRDKVVGIGYCFGGTAVLEIARDGADLAGVVAFHANFDTPDPREAKNIKGRVLALHGANDPIVPDAEVLAFQKEMRDAEVDWQLITYGNAVHSFTNWELDSDNSKPAAYNATADKRSWTAMLDFFNEVFAT
jgi:dienelactone hydrolase